MTAASGISAALTAPFLLDIGFLIWDKHWPGSSFALNLYKCTVASAGFLLVSLVTRPLGFDDDDANDIVRDTGGPFPSDIFTVQSVGFLMLSSTIGILIGDWTWLEALQLIGAKNVVLVDSVKPFLAALFGWMILGETLAWPAFVGMALTVGGVIWVSLEREMSDDIDGHSEEVEGDTKSDEENGNDKFEDDAVILDTCGEAKNTELSTTDEENAKRNDRKEKQSISRIRKSRKKMCKGFGMAIANVFLDTYGSLLTKQYGVGMSTWNISLIRFGFAAAFCIVLSSTLHLRDFILGYNNTKGKTAEETCDNHIIAKLTSLQMSVLALFNYRNPQVGKGTETSTATAEPIASKNTPGEYACNSEQSWYALPRMKRKSWFIITVGVAFVTFATPALTNYALFQTALALALTLGSIGPIYMVPLTWLIQKERPSVRSCLGTVLAVAGVAILSYFGR